MTPARLKKTMDTDYDYDIPGVAVDTDPKAEDLKAAFAVRINKLLAKELVSPEQVAAVIASADSIRQLGTPQSDIVKDLIAEQLLDVCETFGNMDFETADRAYDDYRTNYLLGVIPRLPKFPSADRKSGIRSKSEYIRLKLFKILQ